MKDLKSGRDITNTVKEDEKIKNKGIKDSRVVVYDISAVRRAIDDLRSKGTNEGNEEVRNLTVKAIDKAKDVFDRQDEKMSVEFDRMSGVEKGLQTRAESTFKDVKALSREIQKMKSAETQSAQDDMAQSASAASKDARFLKKSSDQEGDTLSDGKKKMKNLRYFAKNLRNKRQK